MKKVEFVSASGRTVTNEHTFATEFQKRHKAIVADAMEFACNEEDKGGNWVAAKEGFLAKQNCSQGPLDGDMVYGWWYRIGNEILEMRIVENAPDSLHYHTATLKTIG